MHKYKTHVCPRRGKRFRKSPEETIAALLVEDFGMAPTPVLIAVGGPGGTGKSTFSKKLAALLPDSALFRMDDYKTPREERKGKNLYGAHPDANQMNLLIEHLARMSAGKAFDKPVYNTVTGEADATEQYPTAHFHILDGEISTYREFRDMVEFAIFIDSDWKTQLQTRITRDVEERSYSHDKAIATFLQSNLREFSHHGAESKNWSDVHLYCDEHYALRVESVSEDLFYRFQRLLEKDLAEVDLSGLVVPVLTPFTDDDKVDRAALIEHLEWLSHHGIKRILVNGTTAEFFSLTSHERRETLMLAREFFPGVVWLQAGANSLAATHEQVRIGSDYGADAILTLPPYYHAHVPQQGMVDYFNYLGEGLNIPLILYNFPHHTQNPLGPEILNKISHYGIKDSSADLSLIPLTPHYYVGGDTKILDAFLAGGNGFVSARSNANPALYSSMDKALAKGDLEKAMELQEKINAFSKQIPGTGMISHLKHLVAQKIPSYSSRMRLPLLAHSDEG